MPVPDLDATVRGLYRAATGELAWTTVLDALRVSLGATDLQLAPDCAPPLQITWPPGQWPDAATCAWLNRLTPCLQDALRAGHRLRQLPARALTGSALLEALPHPSWLLQAGARVLAENAAARAERDRGGRLRSAPGLLALQDPVDQRRLDAGLAEALGAAPDQAVVVPWGVAPGGGAAGTGQARWLLRRLGPRPNPHPSEHPSPHPGRPGAACAPAPPTVLASLVTPGQAMPLDATVLADAFAFTRGEARVAVHLARGCTAREIASLLGVAPSTVRSHLAQVMAKLGVVRKLDAVRVLAQGGWLWRVVDEGVLDA